MKTSVCITLSTGGLLATSALAWALRWQQPPGQISSDEASLVYNSSRPAVAEGFSKIHAVWTSARDCSGDIPGSGEIYYRRWNGSSWDAEKHFTGLDCYPSAYASIGLDSEGYLHIAWQDGREGALEIYYENCNASNCQPDSTHETMLTTSTGTADLVSLAVDTADNVHIVWRDSRPGVEEVFWKYWNGSSWSTDSLLSPDDDAVSEYPSIAADKLGNVHCVWQDWRSGFDEVYYRKWTPSGGWQTETSLTPPDSLESGNPSVAADSLVHVVWGDESDGQVHYRRWNSGWEDEVVISDGAARATNPAIAAASGRVHVTWWDIIQQSTSQIFYTQFSGSSWHAVDTLTGADIYSDMPSVAVAGNVTHVLYEVDMDGNTTGIFHLRGSRFVPADSLESRGAGDREASAGLGPAVGVDWSINAGRDQITIACRAQHLTRASQFARVFDVEGRLVASRRIEPTMRSAEMTFRNRLAAGVYFVVVGDDKATIMKRAVIVR
jgi:hypothetical protein